MPVGNNGKLQVGVQSDWSTAVAPTLQVEFTKESLKYIPEYKEQDTLVGRQMANEMDIVGEKIGGEFSIICNPDNIGLLVSAVMGAELSPSAVGGSAVYDHHVQPMSAIVGSSLPALTIAVDRLVDVMGYVGTKLDSMTLEAKSQDYLRATFGCIGYDEDDDETTESLSISTKRPYIFSDLTITVDAASYNVCQGMTLNYQNNLEDNLYVANGSTKMIEIEPQKRKITMTLDCLYDSTTNSTRVDKFKTGTPVAIVASFVSTEEILTGYYYTLTISLPKAYITDASPMIGGPDRIRQTLQVEATEGTTYGMRATIRDGRSTKYIA